MKSLPIIKILSVGTSSENLFHGGFLLSEYNVTSSRALRGYNVTHAVDKDLRRSLLSDCYNTRNRANLNCPDIDPQNPTLSNEWRFNPNEIKFNKIKTENQRERRNGEMHTVTKYCCDTKYTLKKTDSFQPNQLELDPDVPLSNLITHSGPIAVTTESIVSYPNCNKRYQPFCGPYIFPCHVENNQLVSSLDGSDSSIKFTCKIDCPEVGSIKNYLKTYAGEKNVDRACTQQKKDEQAAKIMLWLILLVIPVSAILYLFYRYQQNSMAQIVVDNRETQSNSVYAPDVQGYNSDNSEKIN
tara:strand:- start:99 stop:995 length:897 start_codon:yes stop_codon:yes gene_type:complete